ncbi:DUF58 domain-containing protein [Sediminibacillus albus]|uniref:Uncharacterized conserved protein, DUF58 family, contains vWF domain n=1 Tax=Sediminibacillus albus TaxID=407036 RepID=A0A1G9BCX1_9BACI|nr:DUF58 domain-containing protein [Sediminibacillus albus]SDK37299.1 Uncharacterized conserved protein, DUF58 family, contains vWF domain [Sediminibacillus albus]
MKGSLSLSVKFFFVVLLFAVFFSYAMFQGGFVSWFLFYSFLPIIVYMFLLLVYPISNWAVTRRISKHIVQASDNVTVEIEINRRFAFPLYYCIVEEYFPATLQKKDTNRLKFQNMDQPDILQEKRVVKRVSFPWFKRKWKYEYTLENVPRGEHMLGAFRIRTGDFFGFIKKEHIYSTSSRLLVFPYAREISFREKVNSFEEGSAASYNINAKHTNIVTGVREYMPGDRFSWIDWKTTAKKNTVMTKEFEQEKSSNIVLILDAVRFQGQSQIAFEGSIEVAGSLIEFLKNKSSQLTFIGLGEERVFFPSQEDPGKNALKQNYLAKVQPGGSRPFSKQLEQEIRNIPQGLVAMLVVNNFSKETIKPLERLKRKSKKVMVFVIKSSAKLTEEDKRMIHQLSAGGVSVNVITEDKLLQQKLEVSS